MDSSPVTVPTPAPLSKSAQKKAARASYIMDHKLERRAREKERKKEKKRAQLENNVQQPRPKKRTKLGRVEFGARVVIDLGFDELMSDKEIISLCSQLAYTYSANRRASFPFSLLFTALGGRTRTRLDGINDAVYKRWQQTEWWDEGYEQLWAEDEGLPSEDLKHVPAKTARGNVVYLTADADEELTELSPNETYIIGGICDHNRYKNLCLNKSRTSGIRAARLPIGRYLALQTRKVLTVNQAFEILVHWVEMRDWLKAFNAVIPKRKFQGNESGKPCAEVQEDGGELDREGGGVVLDEPEMLEEEGGPKDKGKGNALDAEVRKAPQGQDGKTTLEKSEALDEEPAVDMGDLSLAGTNIK